MFRLLVSAILLWTPAAAAANSAACAACHRTIYDSYRQTPMAQSSGEAGHGVPAEQFSRAAFTHSASGFQYRVSRNAAGYFLEFAKTGGGLGGKKALAYFVGSGAAARSYLLSDGGFLYEAPVAYYSAGRNWDLAPAYSSYAYPYLTRPIVPGCLTCHASFLATVAGTENRFGTPPFGEGGVACERCHGPGEAHIVSAGASGMVNPAKLPPDRRDGVCAQCHLSGEVKVMRPGADWQSYHPGDRLSDSVTVFVRAGSPGMTVTSHVENLAQSACLRASGDRMWCGTCHDPHTVPKPAERAAFFRGKCLTCHAADACKETAAVRHSRGDDCIGCHMQKSPVTDAQHVVYTDHSIPRRPRAAVVAPPASADLVPFGKGSAAPRDLALAYAIAATRHTDAAAQARAMRLLEAAVQNSPDDAEVLLYLAEIYRKTNQEDRAIPLYQRAMRLDPAQVTASAGLGAIRFERGDYTEAIRLWEDALSKNSGLELVRSDLAMAQWRNGDLRLAQTSLEKAVELSPGFAPAADLLKRVREAIAK